MSGSNCDAEMAAALAPEPTGRLPNVTPSESSVPLLTPLGRTVLTPSSIITLCARSDEGFETTLANNYLGHFYLLHLLLPMVEGEASARDTTKGSVPCLCGFLRETQVQLPKQWGKASKVAQKTPGVRMVPHLGSGTLPHQSVGCIVFCSRCPEQNSVDGLGI